MIGLIRSLLGPTRLRASRTNERGIVRTIQQRCRTPSQRRCEVTNIPKRCLAPGTGSDPAMHERVRRFPQPGPGADEIERRTPGACEVARRRPELPGVDAG